MLSPTKTLATVYSFILQKKFELKRSMLGKKTPKRILIFRLGMIGDFVMSLPTIKTLQLTFPDALILIAAPKHAQGICPPGIQFVELSEPKLNRESFREIARFEPDLIVDLSSTPQSLLYSTAAFFSHADRIDVSAEVFADKWFRHCVPIVHWVDYHREFLEKYGIKPKMVQPRIEISPADSKAADVLLLKLGVKKPFFIIFPGSSHPQYRWKAQNFAKVAQLLSPKFTPVLAGGPMDQDAVAKVKGLAKVDSFVLPAVPLNVLAAVFSKAQLCVGMDSGPLHVAAATGCPVVSIFSVGYAYTWYPYSPKSVALFIPDYLDPGGVNPKALKLGPDAFETITVDRVMDGVNIALAKAKRKYLDVPIPFNGLSCPPAPRAFTWIMNPSNPGSR